LLKKREDAFAGVISPAKKGKDYFCTFIKNGFSQERFPML
jgi:hypothetical protein